MTTRNNRLYANNARTTLVTGITTGSTSIVVASATGFPVPTGTDFFNITLDDLVHVEIVKVTSVSGSTFTCVRAQEGTTAFAFTAGAKIEMRLTSAAITSFARSTEKLADYTSVDNLPTPSLSDGNSVLCSNGDSFGVSVIGVTSGTKWRFTNYPNVVRSSTAGASATTTSIALTSASTLLPDATARAYIIQFTSGTYSGLCRVATILTNSITWATALAGVPASGDTYEIYWGGVTVGVTPLPLAGGATMTGLFNLFGDGTAGTHPTTYQQMVAADALKANLASPTFTGTVNGITKSMVGLGNVDNTTDVGKPVSTAQQTALNLKADLAGPTFTGTVSAPTASPGTTTTQVATTQFVTAADNLKADLAGPTFTGTVSAPTVTPTSDSTTKVATTAFVHAAITAAGSYTPTFCLSVPSATVGVQSNVPVNSYPLATALVYGSISVSVLSGALPLGGMSVGSSGMAIYLNGTSIYDGTYNCVIRVTNSTLSQHADFSLTIISGASFFFGGL